MVIGLPSLTIAWLVFVARVREKLARLLGLVAYAVTVYYALGGGLP